MTDAVDTPATGNPKIRTVTLDEPIVRGEERIATLQIRKPGAPELRGLKLSDVVNSDVDALLVLLPRITIPSLIAQEVERMDFSDFLACANEVMLFLPQRGARTASSTT